ncbi:hypothetical protein NEMIN01_1751, partial [Nematocida minor]|uniref:uncharacterized protein n=1 Tax=Nematocida minor TaxID=1912983 RepID=UPI00221EAE3A
EENDLAGIKASKKKDVNKDLNKDPNKGDLEKKMSVKRASISRFKGQIADLKKYLCTKPSQESEFIVFRNINSTKSNLGAHNELFDVLTSIYKRRSPLVVKKQ